MCLSRMRDREADKGVLAGWGRAEAKVNCNWIAHTADGQHQEKETAARVLLTKVCCKSKLNMARTLRSSRVVLTRVL